MSGGTAIIKERVNTLLYNVLSKRTAIFRRKGALDGMGWDDSSWLVVG